MERVGDWIQTFSGRRLWPLDPRPEEIFIEDIAHSLASLCRFTGHCIAFYSVAQHCVLVSQHCPDEDRLWGLLHDASEAYLGDVARPLKYLGLFDEYRRVEARMMLAVCERFGLPTAEPASVKAADKLMLSAEARDLMAPMADGCDWRNKYGSAAVQSRVLALLPHAAEQSFLDTYHEILGR